MTVTRPHSDPDPAPTERLLRINEVAAELGLTTRAIRYYEEMGLLEPAARSDGDYRLYDPSDIERLRFIKRLRDDAGFSLAQIGQMLEDEAARVRNRERLAQTSDPAERRLYLIDAEARVLRQITLLDGKAERLAAMIEDAHARLGRIRAGLADLEDAAMSPATSRATSAFRHRNYRLFFAGQGISLVGTWMQTVAQSWLVLQLTSDPLWLGVVAAAQFIPVLFLGLFAGVYADSLPKRKTLMATQTIKMGLSTILALLAFTNAATIPILILLALVIGTVNAVDMPVRQAFSVEMVGREDIGNAVALNSAMFNGARVDRAGRGRSDHRRGRRGGGLRRSMPSASWP